jgi:hypothetical protein
MTQKGVQSIPNLLFHNILFLGNTNFDINFQLATVKRPYITTWNQGKKDTKLER